MNNKYYSKYSLTRYNKGGSEYVMVKFIALYLKTKHPKHDEEIPVETGKQQAAIHAFSYETKVYWNQAIKTTQLTGHNSHMARWSD